MRLDSADFGTNGDLFATVALVYPQIRDGRVFADATAPNVGKYFVGQRVRVWVAADERPSIVVPGHLVASRFGLDYVMRRSDDGTASAIPVQRGRDTPSAGMADGVEILSGLRAGDVLVSP